MANRHIETMKKKKKKGKQRKIMLQGMLAGGLAILAV